MLKGQGTIELMVLVAFFLLFSIPLLSLLYVSATESAQDSSLIQGRQMSREIIEAADSTYISGEGVTEKIVVIFPHNLQEIKANGREFFIRVRTGSGDSDIVVMGIAELEIDGNIGKTAGPHSLTITSTGERILIKEG